MANNHNHQWASIFLADYQRLTMFIGVDPSPKPGLYQCVVGSSRMSWCGRRAAPLVICKLQNTINFPNHPFQMFTVPPARVHPCKKLWETCMYMYKYIYIIYFIYVIFIIYICFNIYIYYLLYTYTYTYTYICAHYIYYINTYGWGWFIPPKKSGDIHRVRLARRETVETVEPGGTLCGEPQGISDLPRSDPGRNRGWSAEFLEFQHESVL